MKINIAQKIKGLDGIKALPNSETGLDLTLKDVSINAILSPDEKQKDGKKKYTDYEIFVKLRDAEKEIDLSSEEISRIKERGALVLGVLVYGQVVDLLEQKEIKKYKTLRV